MKEIDHFKVFVLRSGDVVVDVEIHLINFSYIVIEDNKAPTSFLKKDSERSSCRLVGFDSAAQYQSTKLNALSWVLY